MRVFYVRPSDNGDYGIEDALTMLAQPPEEVDVAVFRGLRVPLEPLNFDPSEQGFAALHRYDLVILAGLDPVVLAPSECLALVAFVERGGGLMLLGGSHSFSNAEGTYHLLAPILPVEVRRWLDVEVNGLPHGTGHPIARGLPEPAGYIAKVHPVEAKPGAQVVMTAGEFPLVVAGEHGYGRVLVVASYPECQESEYGWFFTGDAFNDFLRGAVAWMTKEHPLAWAESFSLPNREPAPGTECFGKLVLNSATPLDIRVTTRLARDQGETVLEHSASMHIDGRHEVLFSFRVPDGPQARGVHHAIVLVSGADGRELVRRDVAVEIVNPVRVSLEFEHGRRSFPPGGSARLRVHVARSRGATVGEAALEVALIDEAGARLSTAPPRSLSGKEPSPWMVEVELPVPNLRPGAYRVRAELRGAADPIDAASEEIFVLAQPPGAERFPLIAEGGYHLDRPTVERSIGRLAAAGINALSLPGPVIRSWEQRSHGESMLGYAEEQASRHGLSIAHHRRALVPGQEPAAPIEPCPLAPDFREAIQSHARPILAAAARVPALLFHEILAEAAVPPEQFCRCETCEAEFQRKFGVPMPSGSGADLPPAQRRALDGFVASVWSRVYAAILKTRDEAPGRISLCLPLNASSFLRAGPGGAVCDAARWAQACDVVEVAADADTAAFRLSLSGHRALCRALGKSFGAAIDLAQPAPAEAAYTALAHGAAHLRVAENPRFLFWRRQPTVEAGFGRCVRRIAKAGPLLAASKRPAARLALLFPYAQAVERGTARLLAAHELLSSAFGDVDLVHERQAAADGLSEYAAVALLATEMLPRKATRSLIDYVDAGGLLLADRADLRHEDGAAAEWPAGFFGEAETPVFGTLTRRRRAYGAGRTILFSDDLAVAYGQAIEQEDALAVRALRRAVADLLAEQGIRPRARAEDPAIEVGVRLCGESALLVAVNHGQEPRTTAVALDSAAIPAAAAYDLMTGEAVPVEPGDCPALRIALAPRDGGIWALYPERPFSLRIELAQDAFARGGSIEYRVTVIGESGQPARGSHIVRVAVTDPSGAERPELGGQFATQNGLLDAVRRLAVNDPAGTWSLSVTDPLTRRVVRRSFELTA